MRGKKREECVLGWQSTVTRKTSLSHTLIHYLSLTYIYTHWHAYSQTQKHTCTPLKWAQRKWMSFALGFRGIVKSEITPKKEI